MAEGSKSGSARAGCGDMGSMHPIGTRVMQNLTEGKYTSSSDDDSLLALADSVRASAMLASMSVPAVLCVIQDLETDSGFKPIPQMSGDGGSYKVSTSMDLSVNLSNASHYDVHDASQGFSIWTEDSPGSTKNWFFVLPNVYGTKPGTGDSYNGLVIRLCHGVLISWDGRIIRHCTSMMERNAPGGKKRGHNVYGTFFAAKTRHIALGQQQCESKLASAWYQEINDVLGKSQEKEDEEKKLSGADQKSCPAVECHDVVWESEVLAADCELDVMGVRAPAGVDTDDYESMVLSGKMTNSDEVLGNAVLEKPLDCTMAERTNNTACPRVLVPDVVMLLSDGDSLFDDDDGDIPFEGAPTTSDHLAIFSTATATGRCQQQTQRARSEKNQLQPQWTVVDSLTRNQHGSNVGWGRKLDKNQWPLGNPTRVMIGGGYLAVVAIVVSKNNLAVGILGVILKIRMGDTAEEEDVQLDVTFLTKIGKMVREDVDVNLEMRVGICSVNVDVDLVADVAFVFHVADVTRIFGVHTVVRVRVCPNVVGCARSLPNNSMLVGWFVNVVR